MRLFLVLFLVYSTTMIASEECKIYPRLTENECRELLVIQRNYGHYDNDMRKIANRRIQEIKTNLLDDKEKVQYTLHTITSMQIDHIPIKIIQYIIKQRKDYINLPSNAQEELVKYALGVKKKDLSDNASEYLDNKKLFIIPKIVKRDITKK